MPRFRRQSTELLIDDAGGEITQIGAGFAEHPFRKRGSSGDGRGTTASAITDIGDNAAIESNTQSEHVAASRVLDFDHGSRFRQFTNVSGIPEMIQHLFAEHVTP